MPNSGLVKVAVDVKNVSSINSLVENTGLDKDKHFPPDEKLNTV